MAFGFKKKKVNEEAEKKIELFGVISIDIRRSVFHYCTMLGDDPSTMQHRVKSYAGKAFDGEFYLKFKEALAGFIENEPSEAERKMAIVISDEAVALDCIRLPALKTLRLVQNALDVKISDLFLNKDNLKVVTYLADKNKRYYTYNLASMQKGILDSVALACRENTVVAEPITYAAASTITAVSKLMPEWANENYLFLDVKDIYSRFIFVAGGRAVGFYPLPFGLEYLSAGKFTQEDMLFDHTMSEFTVLNAQERAKAKRLSVMRELGGEVNDLENGREVVNLDSMLVIGNGGAEDDDDDDDEMDYAEAVRKQNKTVTKKVEEEKEAQPQETAQEAVQESVSEERPQEDLEKAEQETQEEKKAETSEKIFVKKAPRKLPSFMWRPVPETEEEITKEHFRVFVKWALSLLQGNPMLTALGEPKFVAVNLPKEMEFIFEALKEEEKESGIAFVRFTGADDNEDVKKNLETVGGLYAKDWHVSAKF
jgi:hypothetical protein